MKTHLSLHQRIHNADGSQQIENLKAIHAYTHARNWPVEEWDNIWDLSDDCSWAHGFGRWRGGSSFLKEKSKIRFRNEFRKFILFRQAYHTFLTKTDRKSTRLNSSHVKRSRMPSSA